MTAPGLLKKSPWRFFAIAELLFFLPVALLWLAGLFALIVGLVSASPDFDGWMAFFWSFTVPMGAIGLYGAVCSALAIAIPHKFKQTRAVRFCLLTGLGFAFLGLGLGFVDTEYVAIFAGPVLVMLHYLWWIRRLQLGPVGAKSQESFRNAVAA